MVSSPTIQPFALAMVHVLELINASVMMDGSKAIAPFQVLSHVLVSTVMTHRFVLHTVHVLVKINASVTMGGWDWIARSLIALVSHRMSQMLSVLARASVSVTTSVAVLMDSVDTSARDLQYQNELGVHCSLGSRNSIPHVSNGSLGLYDNCVSLQKTQAPQISEQIE